MCSTVHVQEDLACRINAVEIILIIVDCLLQLDEVLSLNNFPPSVCEWFPLNSSSTELLSFFRLLK